jgi:hypothetical protein
LRGQAAGHDENSETYEDPIEGQILATAHDVDEGEGDSHVGKKDEGVGDGVKPNEVRHSAVAKAVGHEIARQGQRGQELRGNTSKRRRIVRCEEVVVFISHLRANDFWSETAAKPIGGERVAVHRFWKGIKLYMGGAGVTRRVGGGCSMNYLREIRGLYCSKSRPMRFFFELLTLNCRL